MTVMESQQRKTQQMVKLLTYTSPVSMNYICSDQVLLDITLSYDQVFLSTLTIAIVAPAVLLIARAAGL